MIFKIVISKSLKILIVFEKTYFKQDQVLPDFKRISVPHIRQTPCSDLIK